MKYYTNSVVMLYIPIVMTLPPIQELIMRVAFDQYNNTFMYLKWLHYITVPHNKTYKPGHNLKSYI